MKMITYFCTSPVFKKPTLSQINLIKNANNNFLLLKNFKNTESAQLCHLNNRKCLALVRAILVKLTFSFQMASQNN